LSSGETTTKQLRQQRFLTVKAVDVSEPGTVDFPLITSMQDKIKEQLKAQEVSVKDAYGDGRHVRYGSCIHFLSFYGYYHA
jgi:hypothetical protein